MGFISSGNTDIVVYLTPLGAKYLTGNKNSPTDLIVKYFTLGDSDSNYLVNNRLAKYYVPDLTGEDASCLKIVNNTVKTTNVVNDFHRSFVYNDSTSSSSTVINYSVGKSGTVILGNINRTLTITKDDNVSMSLGIKIIDNSNNNVVLNTGHTQNVQVHNLTYFDDGGTITVEVVNNSLDDIDVIVSGIGFNNNISLNAGFSGSTNTLPKENLNIFYKKN